MDDNLADAFGAPRQKTPLEEAWHQEQKRKQYDIIRVKNPTGEDLYVMYDINQFQKVPANSTLDVPRYIAIRYVTHMKDKIVHDKAQKMHDAFIAERRLKGFPDYKNKAEENAETYETAAYPKSNDPKIMHEIMDELWVGMVYEFGRDTPPHDLNPITTSIDLSSSEIKIIENFNKKRVASDAPPVQVYQSYAQPPVVGAAQNAQSAPQRSAFEIMNDRLNVGDITQNE